MFPYQDSVQVALYSEVDRVSCGDYV